MIGPNSTAVACRCGGFRARTPTYQMSWMEFVACDFAFTADGQTPSQLHAHISFCSLRRMPCPNAESQGKFIETLESKKPSRAGNLAGLTLISIRQVSSLSLIIPGARPKPNTIAFK